MTMGYVSPLSAWRVHGQLRVSCIGCNRTIDFGENPSLGDVDKLAVFHGPGDWGDEHDTNCPLRPT
jgi:hypothetical protein